MASIASNLHLVREKVSQAALKVGRDPGDIQIIAVTKTVDIPQMEEAIAAGITAIGENRVQEVTRKYPLLKDKVDWHLIGHLQTNKVKEVTKYADCIQSVDRLELAEKLQKRLEFEDRTIDVFIQVNTSYEASKFGVSPENALIFAQQVKQLDRLNIKGLMTIGLFSAETEKVRKCFQLLKNIQIRMLDKDLPVYDLSMGMSNDLETAIEEGSTIIRIGTAIFGKRPYPDSYYWNDNRETNPQV